MIKKLLNNQFHKVISYNGAVVFLKIISSFIVSKVSAVYLGPSGYALVGNFRNVLQGLLGVTSTGFESGVIKYISENKADTSEQKKVIVNVFALNLLICLCVCPFIFLFSEQLALYILKESRLAFVFKYLSIFFPLVSFSFLIVYIVKGFQKFKLYALLTSISNVLNAILTFVLVYFFNLEGALFAGFLIPVLSFVFAFVFRDIRSLLFQAFSGFKSISFKFFKAISVYLFMAIYSAILISLSYLFIRNSIIKAIDIETAGLWEAMNKIATFYMIFFSSLMTLYLLPKLSQNKTVGGYYHIMKAYFKTLIPVLVLSFLIVFFLRVFIVKVFLTNEFLEISDYFYLQLLGDFFKVIGFSLAYQFHAKKMVTAYMVTDAFLYGVFYLLSVFLITDFSLKGVFYAYLFSTFLYFILVLLFVYRMRYKYLPH
ncbi:O-antigen translocase [Mariniflexile gromovii]|uniref:O-antigen translocase n=1 Tax=Mariniflexile gromovii TaxID=362523 RepID=A0ABS4BSU7_9FLAO|nr:O-antigen translocase [Mariniflexile gromovii]MBP0903654.1 O-antigen translocase [Mariniflexile gromovii]